MISDYHLLLATGISLFFMGAYGLATKKDGLKLILAIEILVVACNLVLIAAGFAQVAGQADPRAETYVLISLSVGGAIIGLALALLTRLYRAYETEDLSAMTELRW